MTTRRNFLGGIAGILACGMAPAIGHAGILMPVRKIVTELRDPRDPFGQRGYVNPPPFWNTAANFNEGWMRGDLKIVAGEMRLADTVIVRRWEQHGDSIIAQDVRLTVPQGVTREAVRDEWLKLNPQSAKINSNRGLRALST